jgi:hypothetical protein
LAKKKARPISADELRGIGRDQVAKNWVGVKRRLLATIEGESDKGTKSDKSTKLADDDEKLSPQARMARGYAQREAESGATGEEK